MDKESIQLLNETLSGIVAALNKNNETLEKILSHYNSVVPPMKENADRANRVNAEIEATNGNTLRGMFSEN